MALTRRKYKEEYHRTVRAAPQLKNLRVNSITVVPEVQRALNMSFVRNKIIADYRPEMVGVLYVSQRDDGTRVVLDGQHRLVAMQQLGLGENEVQCQVYEGLSLQEEAALFRYLNNVLNLKAFDEFIVRITEREPVASGIAWIVEQAGWKLDRQPKKGHIQAVRALENVYRGNRRFTTVADLERVRTVLDVVTAAWGYDKDGVNGSLLQGLGLIIMRFGDQIDYAVFTNKLAKYPGGPAALIGNGRGLRHIYRSDSPNCVAEIIVEAYNSGRHGANRLPSWRS